MTMLYEFQLMIDQFKLEIITEILNNHALYNFYYEQPIEIERVQNGYSFIEIKDERLLLKIYVDEDDAELTGEAYHAFIAKILNHPISELAYQKIENDFQTASFDDIDLGNRWVICYSGEVDRYPSQKVIRFDPQAAFGTGVHETTQDCLKLILNQDFTNLSVLDLGTGSGILTVAARLRKAKKVVAIDYEPVERELLHNLELNNVNSRVEVLQEDLLQGEFKLKESYDWIFINIGSDETLEILKRHDLLNKSNQFLISGLVDWHLEGIIDVFKSQGFIAETTSQTNEWVTIHFIK